MLASCLSYRNGVSVTNRRMRKVSLCVSIPATDGKNHVKMRYCHFDTSDELINLVNDYPWQLMSQKEIGGH